MGSKLTSCRLFVNATTPILKTMMTTSPHRMTVSQVSSCRSLYKRSSRFRLLRRRTRFKTRRDFATFGGRRRKEEVNENNHCEHRSELNYRARDALWASFQESVATPHVPSQPEPPKEMVRIKKRYRFAGEDVM